MRRSRTAERNYYICERCGSRGVCEAPPGQCYAEQPPVVAEAHGALSQRQGYSVESCPFEEGHPRREAWLQGYTRGYRGGVP